jgi:hypothetical protein
MIELVYYFTVRLFFSLFCVRARPEEIKPSMAKHQTRGIGQFSSPQASTTTSNLNYGTRKRVMEVAGEY